MNQADIFTPMLAMMLLTMIVWTYMYSRRIPFIIGTKLDMNNTSREEFERMTPKGVRTPSDNLKNLFEVPILFYALAIYLFVTQQVDSTYMNAAWVFVGFRYLHSAVHCSFNDVKLRFGIYLVSSFALWFMIVRALLNY